jgi:hypothetical protein
MRERNRRNKEQSRTGKDGKTSDVKEKISLRMCLN